MTLSADTFSGYFWCDLELGSRVVSAHGVLDEMTARRLVEAIDLVAFLAPGDLTVDLAGVTSVSLAGLDALEEASRRPARTSVELRFVNGSARQRRLFTIVHLHHLLPSTDADALPPVGACS